MTEKISKCKAVAVVDPSSPAIPEGWADKFAKYVDESHSATTGEDGLPWVSTQNGTFKYMDAEVGKTIEVIVLGAARENLHYTAEFQAGVSNPPSCWALDKDGDGELAPNPDLVPSPCAEACKGCPNDEWGSGKGKGKACRNYIRLVLVTPNDVTSASMLRLPPTAITPWVKYARKIEVGLKRPIFSVVTRLEIKPRGGSFTVVPELSGFVNDSDQLETLVDKVKEVEVDFLKEYEPREEE